MLRITCVILDHCVEHEMKKVFHPLIIEQKVFNTLTEGRVLIIDIVTLKKKREIVCNTPFDRSNTTWIWRGWVLNIFWYSGYGVQYSTIGQSVAPWHRNIEEKNEISEQNYAGHAQYSTKIERMNQEKMLILPNNWTILHLMVRVSKPIVVVLERVKHNTLCFFFDVSDKWEYWTSWEEKSRCDALEEQNGR